MVIVWLVSQDCNYIHNGKIPFLPFSVPRHADSLVLKKLNFIFRRFVHAHPPQSVTALPYISAMFNLYYR